MIAGMSDINKAIFIDIFRAATTRTSCRNECDEVTAINNLITNHLAKDQSPSKTNEYATPSALGLPTEATRNPYTFVNKC